MTRERKQPVIRKPLIDEETALRFATNLQPEAFATPIDKDGKGRIAGKSTGNRKEEATAQVTVNLSKETYAHIVKEAARKKRSVEELLQRHLTKHYGKD